jgi:hypothetical protein
MSGQFTRLPLVSHAEFARIFGSGALTADFQCSYCQKRPEDFACLGYANAYWDEHQRQYRAEKKREREQWRKRP